MSVNEGRLIVSMLAAPAVASVLAIMVMADDRRTAGLVGMSGIFFVGVLTLWAILGPRSNPRRLLLLVALLIGIRTILVPHARALATVADAFRVLLLLPFGFAACLLPVRLAGFRIKHISDITPSRPDYPFALVPCLEWTLTMCLMVGMLWFLEVPIVAEELAGHLLFILWLGLCLVLGMWLIQSADWHHRAFLLMGTTVAAALLIIHCVRGESAVFFLLVIPFAGLLVPVRIAGFRLVWRVGGESGDCAKQAWNRRITHTK